MQTASARTEHRRWATIILQGGSRSGEVWRLLVRKLTRTLISHDRKYSRTHYTCTVPFAFHCNFTSWQHKKSAAQDCNNALVHIVHISNSFQPFLPGLDALILQDHAPQTLRPLGLAAAFRFVFSSMMSTTSPGFRLGDEPCHLLRGCNRCKYSLSHLSQHKAARSCLRQERR